MHEPSPPPVPPDADLTDFKFMPLEVARLRRSKAWLICKRRPELAFYMLNLWTAAWHERPAGSLEDDDDVLADAAMCSPEKWPKVRADVMRGWVKASDGRLYHGVVAEKVMDSWHGKAVARWRKECDRIRKENHRRKEKSLPALDFPAEPTRAGEVFPAETKTAAQEIHGCPKDEPRNVHGIPAENPLKGEGEERDSKGKERKKDKQQHSVAEADAAAAAAAGSREPDCPGPDPDRARPQPRGDGPQASAFARAEVDAAYELWLPVAYDLRIPDVGFLNDERRSALAARLAEIGGINGWRIALEKIRMAQFLIDDDGKPKHWVNLATLLKPEKFTGLMEDRYAEPRLHARAKSSHSAGRQALADWSREGDR